MPEGICTSRAAIVDRIRAANRSVDAALCSAEYGSIAREYQQSSSMYRATVLAVFEERLREYGACVYRTASAGLPAKIGEVFVAHGQRSVVAADDFPRRWLPEGFRWQTEAGVDTETLNRTEGAVVTCEVAIAHTGTIILKGVRRLTLLPDRLCCVVQENQIVETVPEAIDRMQSFATDALTFISGPSATADIEMTRISGVHGPRVLDVVIVLSQRD
jgi:L-lactate dehydrogenase complex protein LldG